MTMTNKENKNVIEDAEFGLDSRYKSRKERESDSTLLMESRLKKLKNLSKDQINRAKLLQLKLKMEDFLRQPSYDTQYHFSNFLRTYIDTIYPTRNKFAQDINITPIRLSQVINNHREPKDEFMMKLMVHSEMVYKSICDFHKKTWYQVYYHEKICDTMSSQEQWRPKIEKEIKLSESIT